MNEGWICPKCGRPNSPYTQTCSCWLDVEAIGASSSPFDAEPIKPPVKIGRVFPKREY